MISNNGLMSPSSLATTRAFVPLRPNLTGNRQLVVSDDKRPALGRRKVAEQNHRDLFQSKLLRSWQTRMARDDIVISAHEDRIAPTPFTHRSGDPGDLFTAVRARVVCARNQALDRPLLDLDVDPDRMASLRFRRQARS